MLPQQKLNQTLVEWDRKAEEYERRVEEAVRAQCAWERFAARKRLELKADATATGEKLTIADLDALIIDADVDDLKLQAALADGVLSAIRSRLRVFAAQADAARSEVASERAREQAWSASPSVPHGGA